MTREQLKAILPNATDEELTATLNAMHSEQKPKANDEELKALREKAKKLDDYEADKLSNEEKLKKALEEAENLKIANAKMLNRTKATEEFVKAGFTAEEIDKFIDVFVSDDEEKTLNGVKGFVDTYSAKSAMLVENAKKDFLNSTPKPDDKGGNTPPPKPKTNAEEVAERIAKNTSVPDSSKLDYYSIGG